jgi:ABC-type transport system involved in multi-copper enzyme maturation permease subunit
MNTMYPANANRQYLPKIRSKSVVFGILVKERTRLYLMFTYLFVNSAVIFWLSTVLIQKDANGEMVFITNPNVVVQGLTQSHTDPNIILYFRLLVISIPLIIGLLIGVPLLSTEYESGTYRFLFTQGVGRWRLVRTIFVVYFASIALLSVMTITAINHFLTVQRKADSIQIWSFMVFVCHPIIIIPLTLTICFAGVFLGTLIQRVIPALAATMLFVLMLALGFKTSFEKILSVFAQRLYGSHGDPIQAYYNFIGHNDPKYLFRFQMGFASVLIIFSLIFVLGSLRALNTNGFLHKKLRP